MARGMLKKHRENGKQISIILLSYSCANVYFVQNAKLKYCVIIEFCIIIISCTSYPQNNSCNLSPKKDFSLKKKRNLYYVKIQLLDDINPDFPLVMVLSI